LKKGAESGKFSERRKIPMSQAIATAPKLELTVAEIEVELLPELQEYHAIYSPLFRRREQREESEKYLKGLLSEIENKSVESMVLLNVRRKK